VLSDAASATQIEIRLTRARKERLELKCNQLRFGAVLAQGGALSFILEEKILLGLALPPQERVPVESLSEEDLVKLAIAEREEQGDVRADAGAGAGFIDSSGRITP